MPQITASPRTRPARSRHRRCGAGLRLPRRRRRNRRGPGARVQPGTKRRRPDSHRDPRDQRGTGLTRRGRCGPWGQRDARLTDPMEHKAGYNRPSVTSGRLGPAPAGPGSRETQLAAAQQGGHRLRGALPADEVTAPHRPSRNGSGSYPRIAQPVIQRRGPSKPSIQ